LKTILLRTRSGFRQAAKIFASIGLTKTITPAEPFGVPG
jgi:hypothetical protein